ncbi:PH domain-containing protein [Streptomyces sp. NPDC050560]|uniref:PH domain-containing protein n=1 Tax=Streptomyces sp. NPDC050560 TaxID=3365630 RepID=UPI003796EDE7
MTAAPTPAAPPELPVTFRPAATRAVLLAGGAAVFAALTVIGALLPGIGPGERASFAVSGLLILAVLVLLSRPRISADTEGVTVVNIASSRRVAWPEIVRVNLRAGDSWVFLDLSDGTSLPALGIQTGLAGQRAVRDARALRALAAAHSPAGAGDGTTAENRHGA